MNNDKLIWKSFGCNLPESTSKFDAFLGFDKLIFILYCDIKEIWVLDIVTKKFYKLFNKKFPPFLDLRCYSKCIVDNNNIAHFINIKRSYHSSWTDAKYEIDYHIKICLSQFIPNKLIKDYIFQYLPLIYGFIKYTQMGNLSRNISDSTATIITEYYCMLYFFVR